MALRAPRDPFGVHLGHWGTGPGSHRWSCPVAAGGLRQLVATNVRLPGDVMCPRRKQ